jgi:hypothetical protein
MAGRGGEGGGERWLQRWLHRDGSRAGIRLGAPPCRPKCFPSTCITAFLTAPHPPLPACLQGQQLLNVLRSSSAAPPPAKGQQFKFDSAVGLYCRAALHLALTMVLDPPEEQEGQEEEEGQEGEGREARLSSSEALAASGVALNECIEMSEEVLQSCLEQQGGQAAGSELTVACLEFVAVVLAVVADAQQLSILDLGASAEQARARGRGGEGEGVSGL